MTSYALEHFTRDMEALLAPKPPIAEILGAGSQHVHKLLGDTEILNQLLTRLVLDDSFLKAQYQAIDPNDIIIYRSPQRSFSLRAFIWEPGVRYPIHDHGSWGIVGVYLNPVRERKYLRVDDGQQPHAATVQMKSDEVLLPGQVTTVLPMNDGIHQMENAGDRGVAVSIHMYGAPVRKGYIQLFDPHFNSVRRVYPPQAFTRALAIRTLGSIAQPWSKKVLEQASNSDLPDFMKEECLNALEK